MIGPTDLLHPSAAPHFKTFQAYIHICFVDRISQYIRINKTNLMHYLSSVYFVYQPLHVSGVPTQPRRQSTKKNNKYQLLYIYMAHLLMMDYKYARNMCRLIDEIYWWIYEIYWECIKLVLFRRIYIYVCVCVCIYIHTHTIVAGEESTKRDRLYDPVVISTV